jgi:hypothetical protein
MINEKKLNSIKKKIQRAKIKMIIYFIILILLDGVIFIFAPRDYFTLFSLLLGGITSFFLIVIFYLLIEEYGYNRQKLNFYQSLINNDYEEKTILLSINPTSETYNKITFKKYFLNENLTSYVYLDEDETLPLGSYRVFVKDHIILEVLPDEK